MTGYLKRRNKTISSKKTDIITGTYIGSQRGYGFVRPADSVRQDIYIAEKNAGSAFHGDTVEAVILSKAKDGTHAFI